MKKWMAVFLALLMFCLSACSPAEGGAAGGDTPAGPQGPGAEVAEEDIEYIFNRMCHPRVAQTAEHFYYVSSVDGSLYRVSLDAGNFEVLFQADDVTYFGNLRIIDDQLYFTKNGVMQRANLDGSAAAELIGNREIVSPYFTGGYFYCNEENSSAILQYDMAGSLVKEHTPTHYDVYDSEYVVLGDMIFYYGQSEADANKWDFYSYKVGTGEETVEYAGIFNYYNTFAVDAEYFYLQLAGPGGSTQSADRLVISRETGEIVKTLPSAGFFVKFGDQYYTLNDEGLVEFNETGVEAVVAANPWMPGGVNKAGEYLLYCDANRQCDVLVRPDGTGEITLQ